MRPRLPHPYSTPLLCPEEQIARDSSSQHFLSGEVTPKALSPRFLIPIVSVAESAASVSFSFDSWVSVCLFSQSVFGCSRSTTICLDTLSFGVRSCFNLRRGFLSVFSVNGMKFSVAVSVAAGTPTARPAHLFISVLWFQRHFRASAWTHPGLPRRFPRPPFTWI